MSTAYARVTLTIVVDVDSCWGDGCTITQVKKQAVDEAHQTLHNAFKSDLPKIQAGAVKRIRVERIDPEIEIVINGA